MPMPRPRSLVLVGATLVLAGCAHFDDSGSTPFSPAPETTVLANPEPQFDNPVPEGANPDRPEVSCPDPDPAVVAGCLDTVAAIVPDAEGAALVAERRSGRVLRVASGVDPVEVARIPVAAAGNGGLTSLVPSPSYAEDGLLYAYLSEPAGGRVVRVAPGDSPKTVLDAAATGGAGSRGGAIAFADEDTLIVATSGAADGGPGDGAVLAVHGMRGTAPRVERLAGGLHEVGGLCLGPAGSVWVTDRTADGDRLLQRSATTPGALRTVWTWPERPGVAGCLATEQVAAVALSGARSLTSLAVDASATVLAPPETTLTDTYGALTALAAGPDGAMWVGNADKALRPDAVAATDDRVVKLQLPSGGGSVD